LPDYFSQTLKENTVRNALLVIAVFFFSASARNNMEFYGRTYNLLDSAGKVDQSGMAFGFYGLMGANMGKYFTEEKLGKGEFGLGWATDMYAGGGSADGDILIDLTWSVPCGITGSYMLTDNDEIGFYYVPLQLEVFMPSAGLGSKIALTYRRNNLQAKFSRFSNGLFLGCFLPGDDLMPSYLASAQYILPSSLTFGATYGLTFGDNKGNIIMVFLGWAR
jgi:hypothetical protein